MPSVFFQCGEQMLIFKFLSIIFFLIQPMDLFGNTAVILKFTVSNTFSYYGICREKIVLYFPFEHSTIAISNNRIQNGCCIVIIM